YRLNRIADVLVLEGIEIAFLTFPGAFIHDADDAEVDIADDIEIEDDNVGGVRIGVKFSHLEYLAHPDLEDPFRNQRQIDAGGPQLGQLVVVALANGPQYIADPDALQILHGKHAPGRVLIEHARNFDNEHVRRGHSGVTDVASLGTIVEFL